MTLRRILYTSLTAGEVDPRTLAALALESSRRNEKVGVSGVLLFSGGRFLQVLEGEPDTVEPLYERIALDPRHTEVTRVLADDTDERMFTDWGMRLCNLDSTGAIEPGVLVGAKDVFAACGDSGRDGYTRWILEFFERRRSYWNKADAQRTAYSLSDDIDAQRDRATRPGTTPPERDEQRHTA